MRIRATVAIPSWLVVCLGVVLVAVGVAVPIWSIAGRTQERHVTALVFGSGPLRPSMITLPPMEDGRVLAIAETEVTQAQFYRVYHRMPVNVAVRRPGGWSHCPAPVDVRREMPVTCVSVTEARAYADRLTRLENSVRPPGQPPLTPCYEYRGDTLQWTDPQCTGYRLPTEEEMTYAATIGGTLGVSLEKAAMTELGCDPEMPDGCPDASWPSAVTAGVPNAWFLFLSLGNARELIAVGDGASGVWNGARLPSAVSPFPGSGYRHPDVGFRVVYNPSPLSAE